MPPSIRLCPLQYLSDLVTAARPLWRKEGRRAAGAPHPPTLLLRSLEAVTLLAEAGLRERILHAVQEKVTLEPAIHPAALLWTFLFPFESVEAFASQTGRAGD